MQYQSYNNNKKDLRRFLKKIYPVLKIEICSLPADFDKDDFLKRFRSLNQGILIMNSKDCNSKIDIEIKPIKFFK